MLNREILVSRLLSKGYVYHMDGRMSKVFQSDFNPDCPISGKGTYTITFYGVGDDLFINPFLESRIVVKYDGLNARETFKINESNHINAIDQIEEYARGRNGMLLENEYERYYE